MTRARKAALQWFYDRGEVKNIMLMDLSEIPSITLIFLMMGADQLGYRISGTDTFHSLTDKGRRMLNGDSK